MVNNIYEKQTNKNITSTKRPKFRNNSKVATSESSDGSEQQLSKNKSSSKTSRRTTGKTSLTTNKRRSSRSDVDRIEANKRKNRSVLIIGAAGRTGVACLRRLSRHEIKPKIHAFCRKSSKLSQADKNICQSIFEGNAMNQDDIEAALRVTKAKVVVLCVGNGTSILEYQTYVRTISAQVLVNVMQLPKFKHVRAMVLSRIGAGDSKIEIGCGIGTVISNRFRFVLKDHNGQEEACAALRDRITIIRPTSLNNQNATGMIVQFGAKTGRYHTNATPRSDLASWIVEEIYSGMSIGGKVANITGLKAPKKKKWHRLFL